MKLRDIQAFIPGWQIVYMVREYRKMMNGIEESERAMTELKIRGQEDYALAQEYVQRRMKAAEEGRLNVVRECNDKILALAESYMKRISA